MQAKADEELGLKFFWKQISEIKGFQRRECCVSHEVQWGLKNVDNYFEPVFTIFYTNFFPKSRLCTSEISFLVDNLVL